MENKTIDFVIIGAGRFGREAAEIAKRMEEKDKNFKFLGFIDEIEENHGKLINEVPVLGGLEWIGETFTGEKLFFVCSIGDTINRKEVVERALKFGYIPHSIIHPSVLVRYGAKIGDGSIIGPKSVIGPNVFIKDHVIINQICSIGHDDIINDFCTISPLAALSGGVVLGEGTYFGTLLFAYAHDSGVILRKSVLDLKKALQYAGSLWGHHILIGQALIAGDTLYSTKIFSNIGKDEYKSEQPFGNPKSFLC